MVGEAPPEDLKRFFYYEDVYKADWLFLGVIKALGGDLYATKSLRENKACILELSKKYGIFLMDLSDSPTIVYDYESFNNKIKNEKAVDKDNTNIILIKVTVYDFLYKKMISCGYKVMPQRIPFPAFGQQKKFDCEFKKALESAKFPVDNFEKDLMAIMKLYILKQNLYG